MTATPRARSTSTSSFTRAKLGRAHRVELLDRIVGPTKQALSDAGLTPDQIDQVILAAA